MPCQSAWIYNIPWKYGYTSGGAQFIEGHPVTDFDTQSAFNSIDGEQRRPKHPGFNPYYTITI